MRKIIVGFFFFLSVFSYAQTDYSDSWFDFYSYNNVKDFVIVDEVIYALSDNAVFTYNTSTKEIEKLSSVNGLSGEETSAIYYSEFFNKLVIGYNSGLLEIVDEDDIITYAPDIVNFNKIGLKSINGIYEYNSKLYLATAFAIVIYDLDKLEFGDTYFIGSESSDVFVNDIIVFEDTIYAVTESGVYTADVNANNLVDSTNWNQITTGNFQGINEFNNELFVTSNTSLQKINGSTFEVMVAYPETISDIKSNDSNLIVTLTTQAKVYNTSLTEIGSNSSTTDFDFTLNTAFYNNNNLYLGTSEFGILSSAIGNLNYEEIHPSGALSNDVFAIDVYNSNLWVVYGGYDAAYTPSQARQGFSHYNGEEWINTPRSVNLNGDLVHVTIDEDSNNRVFISSFGDTNQVDTKLTGGLFEIENDEVVNFYNHLNSPLEDIVPDNPDRVTIRISGTVFDDDGNLWVTNLLSDSKIKKISPSGQWTSYDVNSLYIENTPGMNDIVIDRSNTKWVGTRGNGVYVFNESGDQKVSLTTEINKGSLPGQRVECVAVDESNDVWIGTTSGLVVFYDTENIFNLNLYNAESVIIEENGEAERLLGEQNVTKIAIDGANNKWFGTDSGGVLHTNSTGKTTLAQFTKSNSPLPSNRILDIAIDDSTGLVYFVTDKGLVAYDSNVSPYGNTLGEVYAYPNPVLKNHSTVTIDGRNGTHLPENTNVKILDVAGNLVYETNVTEGQEINGGKVVWDKRNLAGTKVASGIYIVLLATEDGSESQTAKIAIVN